MKDKIHTIVCKLLQITSTYYYVTYVTKFEDLQCFGRFVLEIHLVYIDLILTET
jgi:hypothetical protein